MFVHNLDPVAFEILGLKIYWYSLSYLFGFIFSGSYRKLYRFKTIIATTNAIGICLALSKKLGFLENEVIFINMGF